MKSLNGNSKADVYALTRWLFLSEKRREDEKAKARIVTASRSGGGMPKISLPRSGATRILLGGERSTAICVPRSPLPPTENPLRSWRPSLFPLSSSSISLCSSSPPLHSSLTLLRFYLHFHYHQTSSSSNPVTLSEFLENSRVPEELFGISAAVAVQRVGAQYVHCRHRCRDRCRVRATAGPAIASLLASSIFLIHRFPRIFACDFFITFIISAGQES